MAEGFANVGLVIVYILIAVAILAMIFFPIKHLIDDPKGAKYTLYGIGGIVLLFFLSYLLASSEVANWYERYGVGSTESKFIGAGLITLYILGMGAIALAIFSEISKITK